MTSTGYRHPHAVLDLDSRRLKAIKIERLLELRRRPPGFRVLEIGCGSGGIAHYFAVRPDFRCKVDAIDVVDNRQVAEGYRFHAVEGIRLPFPDARFDVVISNHVIEHVGDEKAQREHLIELRRVMKADGVGYLAVPNRWQLVEPHYHLAFLSWLPRALRTPYLRLSGRGTHYDCEPLEMRDLEKLLLGANLGFRNACVAALHATLEIEGGHDAVRRIVGWVPDAFWQRLRAIIPTLIYVLWALPGDAASGTRAPVPPGVSKSCSN